VPAFWTGLLYDRAALDAAWELVRGWSAPERQALRDAVPRAGLRTPFRRGTVLDVAREAAAIARAGLARRALKDAQGNDETRFLDPVEAIVREGMSPAQEMLGRYEGAWSRSVAPLFTEYAF
jgi:glutamate--cysteine ligase